MLGKTTHGSSRVMLVTGLLALAGWVAVSNTACRRGGDLEIMPERTLNDLSMTRWERPRGYALVTDTNALYDAGIKKNPGYITRRADVEATLKLGGLMSFLAVLGVDDVPRLLIHGVYFKDQDKLEDYIEIQMTRKRAVRALRRETRDGWWLVTFARDPELDYTEAEHDAIRRGIDRYQRRLNMDEVFDQLDMNRDKSETP